MRLRGAVPPCGRTADPAVGGALRALLGAASVTAALAIPRPAAAQEDFRAADLDRPLRVEDAQPVKRHEWELEVGLRAARGDEDAVEGILELKTGLFLNGEAGVGLHVVDLASDGEDGFGLEGVAFHVLHGLARETPTRPAFAVRLEAETPGAGDPGHEGWAFTAKAIATRSFDRLRAHANLGYTAADSDDGGDFWQGGLAFDYPIGLFSRSVLGDVYAEIPTRDAGDARVWATVGSRWQLTNWTVLDAGIGTRLDEWADGDANVELVIGLSRVFGIAALVDVPAYPEPRLD